jgi:hypothetical protein
VQNHPIERPLVEDQVYVGEGLVYGKFMHPISSRDIFLATLLESGFIGKGFENPHQLVPLSATLQPEHREEPASGSDGDDDGDGDEDYEPIFHDSSDSEREVEQVNLLSILLFIYICVESLSCNLHLQ